MTLSVMDWLIVVSYVVGCATIGLLVKRYVLRVADFAVAGRSVGINMGVAAMTCTGTGTLLIGALYLPWTNWVGASAALILGAVAPLSCVVVNATVDASHRFAPATAGLSAYAMALGGLVVGSLLGNCFLQKTTVAEAAGGQD